MRVFWVQCLPSQGLVTGRHCVFCLLTNVVCTYAAGGKACSGPCCPLFFWHIPQNTGVLVFTSLMLKPGLKGNEAKSEVCFCKDGSASRVALPAGKDLRSLLPWMSPGPVWRPFPGHCWEPAPSEVRTLQALGSGREGTVCFCHSTVAYWGRQ